MKKNAQKWEYHKEVLYTNIVMGHHDKTKIVPKHTPHLTLLRLLVEDHFRIFITKNTPSGENTQTEYKTYCTDINMAISLYWKCSPLRSTVDFFDFTITILTYGYLNL